MMTDHSHHYADVERVLYCGFEKIRKEIAEMQVGSTDEQEFKDSMLAACDAAIALGYKFSEEADRMLQTEKMILYGNSLSESVTQQEEFHVFRQRHFMKH